MSFFYSDKPFFYPTIGCGSADKQGCNIVAKSASIHLEFNSNGIPKGFSFPSGKFDTVYFEDVVVTQHLIRVFPGTRKFSFTNCAFDDVVVSAPILGFYGCVGSATICGERVSYDRWIEGSVKRVPFKRTRIEYDA